MIKCLQGHMLLCTTILTFHQATDVWWNVLVPKMALVSPHNQQPTPSPLPQFISWPQDQRSNCGPVALAYPC